MTDTDFAVSSTDMIISSSGFTDLYNWMTNVYPAMSRSLASYAGMAGNDSLGHAFAAKVDPSAQGTMDGLHLLVDQIGGYANGSFSMAMDYIRSDWDTPGALMTPYKLRSEHANIQRTTIPSVTNDGPASNDPSVDEFWPQGNPAQIREAAADWRKLAGVLVNLRTEGDRLIARIANSRSSAINSLKANWDNVGSISNEDSLLAKLIAVSSALGSACEMYAAKIDGLHVAMTTPASTAVGFHAAETAELNSVLTYANNVVMATKTVVLVIEDSASPNNTVAPLIGQQGLEPQTYIVGADPNPSSADFAFTYDDAYMVRANGPERFALLTEMLNSDVRSDQGRVSRFLRLLDPTEPVNVHVGSYATTTVDFASRIATITSSTTRESLIVKLHTFKEIINAYNKKVLGAAESAQYAASHAMGFRVDHDGRVRFYAVEERYRLLVSFLDDLGSQRRLLQETLDEITAGDPDGEEEIQHGEGYRLLVSGNDVTILSLHDESDSVIFARAGMVAILHRFITKIDEHNSDR